MNPQDVAIRIESLRMKEWISNGNNSWKYPVFLRPTQIMLQRVMSEYPRCAVIGNISAYVLPMFPCRDTGSPLARMPYGEATNGRSWPIAAGSQRLYEWIAIPL